MFASAGLMETKPNPRAKLRRSTSNWTRSSWLEQVHIICISLLDTKIQGVGGLLQSWWQHRFLDDHEASPLRHQRPLAAQTLSFLLDPGLLLPRVPRNPRVTLDPALSTLQVSQKRPCRKFVDSQICVF